MANEEEFKLANREARAMAEQISEAATQAADAELRIAEELERDIDDDRALRQASARRAYAAFLAGIADEISKHQAAIAKELPS